MTEKKVRVCCGVDCALRPLRVSLPTACALAGLAGHRSPELAAASLLQAIIKNADMSEEMQHACIDCASQAMERFNIEKDIAACACAPRRRANASDDRGGVLLAREKRRRQRATARSLDRASYAAPPASAPCLPDAQTSRRSLTRSTARRGTSSSAATLAAT